MKKRALIALAGLIGAGASLAISQEKGGNDITGPYEGNRANPARRLGF